MLEHDVDLHLTSEEKREYYRLFQIADKTNLGVITGEVAVGFFDKTGLPSETLGQIWQIADTEDRGLLTATGFGIVMRLIGHAQAGRTPTAELALQPGPLPVFSGLEYGRVASPAPAAVKPTATTPASQVPPISPEEMLNFMTLFNRSEPQDGMIPGDHARQIFERSRLPNETLGQIWNLVDTQSRGSLDQAEFIIAMHLLTAARSRVMVTMPSTLPPSLYDTVTTFVVSHAAPVRARSAAGFRPTTPATQQARVNSPMGRPFGALNTLSPQVTGQSVPRYAASPSIGNSPDWLVSPAEKQQFDTIFASIDRTNSGYISGEQAVSFFSQAKLGEEVLAQIWDLADIDSDGRLSRDEFAVAMYLIKQQRIGQNPVPSTLPPSLVPPSMRSTTAFSTSAPPPIPSRPAPKSAVEDLLELDAFSDPTPAPAPAPAPAAAAQTPQATGGMVTGSGLPKAIVPQVTGNARPATPGTAAPGVPAIPGTFKPFVPTSSFGQSLTPQYTGQSARAAAAATPAPAPTAPAPTPAPAVPQTQAPASVFGAGPFGSTGSGDSRPVTSGTSANLSDQFGALSREALSMQQQCIAAEQQLTRNSSQRREFETKLAEARTTYQKEIDEFRTLEDRLKSSRVDTAQKQTEYALLEGQRADLKAQFDKTSAALDNDIAENASIKEKIKNTNAAIASLKSQLEKAEGDASKQKGLVSINEKQLATVEAEWDKLRTQSTTANDEPSAARDDIPEPAHSQSPAVGAPGTPLSAASSANPFSRQQTGSGRATGFSSNEIQSEGSSQQSAHQPPSSTSKDKQSLFDNIFGAVPSKPATPSSKPAPTTSFRGASSPVSASPVAASDAKPFQFSQNEQLDGAHAAGLFPDHQRAVIGDESQWAATGDLGDASDPFSSPHEHSGFGPATRDLSDYPRDKAPSPNAFDFSSLEFDDTDNIRNHAADSVVSRHEPHVAGQAVTTIESGNIGDVAPSQAPLPLGSALGSPGRTSTTDHIRIAHPEDTDEDSSSDEEGPEPVPGYKPGQWEEGRRAQEGPANSFDFPFASASTTLPTIGAAPAAPGPTTSRPETSRSPQPLAPVADMSGSATAFDQTSFLDAFEAPGTTSATRVTGRPQSLLDGSALEPRSPVLATTTTSPPLHPAASGPATVAIDKQAPATTPAPFEPINTDKLEIAFAGVHLTPTRATDQDPGSGSESRLRADFDFPFSQPSAPSGAPATDAELLFSPTVTSAAQQPAAFPTQSNQPSRPSATEDWDSIFSGLGKPTHQSTPSFPNIPPAAVPQPSRQTVAPSPIPQGEGQHQPQDPPDDPILQRLTAMGYAREESLRALESCDYDLNSAANHLANQHFGV